MNDVNVIFLSYLLIIIGSVFTHGFYSFGGVIIILGSFLLLNLRGTFSSQKMLNGSYYQSHIITILLIISTALSVLLYGGLYQREIWYISEISQLLLIVSFLLSLLYIFPEKKSFIFRYKFPAMILIFLFVQVLMIISSPDPLIDIFRSLKYGTAALASFRNPYQEIYPAIYQGKVLDYFSYFPAILFYILPFRLILGDPRYGIIFGQILVVFIIYRVLRIHRFDVRLSEILVLLFIYYPLNSYITEQSFVDIVILLGVTFFLFFIYWPQKKSYVFYIACIILMNTKQLFFFLMPVFLYRTGIIKSIKEALKVYLLAFILPLPFLVWSAKDFLYDTIFIYLLPPQGVSADLSLNLRALFVNFAHVRLSQNVFLIWTLLYFIFVIWTTGRKNISLFQSLCRFFVGFFLLGSIAYLNHYYLASGLTLLYAFSLLLDNNNRRPAKAG